MELVSVWDLLYSIASTLSNEHFVYNRSQYHSFLQRRQWFFYRVSSEYWGFMKRWRKYWGPFHWHICKLWSIYEPANLRVCFSIVSPDMKVCGFLDALPGSFLRAYKVVPVYLLIQHHNCRIVALPGMYIILNIISGMHCFADLLRTKYFL